LLGDEMTRLPALGKRGYSPILTKQVIQEIEQEVTSTPKCKFNEVRDNTSDSLSYSILMHILSPAMDQARLYCTKISKHEGAVDIVSAIMTILLFLSLVSLMPFMGVIPLGIWILWGRIKKGKIRGLMEKRDWLISHQLNSLGYETLGYTKVLGQPAVNLNQNGYVPPNPSQNMVYTQFYPELGAETKIRSDLLNVVGHPTLISNNVQSPHIQARPLTQAQPIDPIMQMANPDVNHDLKY
jgi:hypothetical protein